MDINKIKESMEILKESLGEGFLSGDVWTSGSAQSVLTHNGGNPKATAMFDQITISIKKALHVASFSEIDPYYLLHLENGYMVLVMEHGDCQWGMMIDPEKSPLGLVLNVAMPSVIEKLNEA